MDPNYDRLLFRIERLERRNRLLTISLLIVPILAMVGWQTVPAAVDVARVRSLEVVDERGVPMVILGTGRKGEGGSITLRDSQGEKRGWWQVAPDGSSLTMASDAGSDNPATAGFGVTPKSSRFTLISPKGASLSASIENEQPRIDLYSDAGKVLFGAPWKSGR